MSKGNYSHFITVRNGNSEALENVARGNEKVPCTFIRCQPSSIKKKTKKLVIEDNIKKPIRSYSMRNLAQLATS
ncbi:hypothetical protein ACEQPO_19380 [Bacillus sp. SL00103]